MLRTDPAVFAVGNNYQIIITSKSQSFISVKIGDKLFVDDSNGILRSSSRTHKFDVPQELLNTEKHYTVIEKTIIKRLPYFTKTRKDKYFEYDFRPIPESNAKCYHIADAHNDSVRPVKAYEAYGKADFLILNGDIPNHSGTVKNFETVFDLCSAITHGNIPVVFARGNHDLRGICAEKFAEYTPSQDGRTYYSFRIGSIWGLCLDCGEDKPDTNEEYGCTVCCHLMRERETEYLKQLIKNADTEYNAPGVRTRLIITHNPFTRQYEAPFNIEEDLYRDWLKLLKKHVKPDLIICGHTHKYSLTYPGDPADYLGQPCPVLVAAQVPKEGPYGGAGIEFGDKKITVIHTDSDGKVTKKFKI